MIPTGGRRRVRLGGMPRAKQEITGRSHEPMLSTRVLLQTSPTRLGRGRGAVASWPSRTGCLWRWAGVEESEEERGVARN